MKISSLLIAICVFLPSSILHAAITESFMFGDLILTSDSNDSIVVTAENGLVKVNGSDPALGPVNAADVDRVELNGGPGGNILDASGVSDELVFTQSFVLIEINGGPGDDTITGGGFRSELTGGGGTDTLTAGTGFCAFEWTAGEGSDSFNKGPSTFAEIDLILSESFSDEDTKTFFHKDQGNIVMEFSSDVVMTTETVTINQVGNYKIFATDGDTQIVIDDISNLQVSQFRIFPGDGTDFIDSRNSGIGLFIDLQRSETNSTYLGSSVALDTFDFGINGANDTMINLEKNGKDFIFSRSEPQLMANGKATMQGFESVSISTGRSTDQITIGNLEGTDVEQVFIRLSEGSDQIQMVGSSGISFDLNGDAFSPDDPPVTDSLTIDAEMLSVINDPGEVNIGGKGLITHNGFENVSIINRGPDPSDSWSLN